MIDHTHQCVQPDAALSQLLVAVFVRTAGVHAVVEVYSIQAVQSDHLVKLGQHAVQVVCKVESGIQDEAGVQAYAHFF